ncbi:MAG: family 78 glycoside hydrolase catalytic domain, partial [Kiritimatiellae bacterium]|nr:family 78 glycoside hydrolase catalytic domain [Kiritimatiellia bacterium]
SKSVLVVAAATAAACIAAGGPSDYKKTVQRRVAPVKVESRIPGRTLVDFGKMAFGFLELVPPAGARGPYEVRLGELLKPDGSVNMKPGATIRAARVTGVVEADGVLRVPLVADRRNTNGGREGAAILIPPEHGVIMPFRYVEVMQAPFTVTKDTVRMVAVNYPIDLTESSFSCSDERLNRIYDLCKHTILVSSFAGIYVDGDRERIPYEADAYINQLSDYAVHSDYSLARASHAYLMKHPTWPTEWKQHSILMAWADWMWTGDASALAEFYEPLCKDKLSEKYRRASDGLLATGGERPRGKLVNANGAADIVDWPLGERDGFVFTEVNAVVNAFYYRNLLQVAEFALALHKPDDAGVYGHRARDVRKAYNAAFFDAKRGVYRDGIGTDHASLHANAAALAFGLVHGKDAKRVAQYCISKGMACSVYFAQYLLEGLFNAGEADAAIALMTASGDRSWLGMMDQGATTTMEAWAVKYKPNLDLCHAWGTPPLNVISRYILGVTPLEPGFAKIRVRPQVGSLARVEGKVPTAKGPVSVRVEGGVLTLDVPAPARVEWAGAVHDVAAGHHVFPARN